MVPNVRFFSITFTQIRRASSSHTPVSRQVFVRKNDSFLTRRTLFYSSALVTAIGYNLWFADDTTVSTEYIAIDSPASQEAGATPKNQWQVFIRCTSPRHVVKRRADQLTGKEREKLQLAKKFLTDKEKLDSVVADLVNNVNNRAQNNKFFGAGLPNSLRLIGLTTTVMPIYYYEADGILITSTGIQWTNHKIAPRAKNDFDKVISYPMIAVRAFLKAVEFYWWAPVIRPQVISGTAPNGRQPASSSQSQDTGLRTSEHNQESSTVESSQSTPSSGDTSSQKASQSPENPVDQGARTMSNVLSTGNHVNIITSFLSQQKDAVKQSSGLVPTDRAHAFFRSFSKEFAYQRLIKAFQTYDPPDGNILFSGNINITGPRNHVILAVDTDYDPSTDTWGPIFIEPLLGVRHKAISDLFAKSRSHD